MSEIFDFIFTQYKANSTIDISLEIIAVIFGFLSVWFSKENKIWVFPTGMISTSIFVYLLLKWGAIRGHDDKCLLFCNEYLWLVYLDS